MRDLHPPVVRGKVLPSVSAYTLTPIAVFAPHVEAVVQNSVSKRMTAQDRAVGAMASNWAEAFEKLQSQDTPVQRRAGAARASTRVETLREVFVQDQVADRPVLPGRTSALAEAVEKLRRRRARDERRTIAAHARARSGKKQPTPSWEDLEEELRRSQEALRARVAVSNRAEPAEP
jgi:hypothetical protein